MSDAWITRIRGSLNPPGNNGNNGADSEPPNLPSLPQNEGVQYLMDPTYSGNGHDDYGSELPPPSSYGPFRPPMGERVVSTLATVDKLTEGEVGDLWIFKSQNVRHFQFTNYTGADVRRLQEKLQLIIVVHRWGAKQLAHDLQVEVFMDMLARKSRSDLADNIRERPLWSGWLSGILGGGGQSQRPKESAGFFGLWGRGKDRGGYP